MAKYRLIKEEGIDGEWYSIQKMDGSDWRYVDATYKKNYDDTLRIFNTIGEKKKIITVMNEVEI